VRRGHRGTRLIGKTTSGLKRGNVNTGCNQVDASSIVGKLREAVVDVAGSDGDGFGSGCGGGLAGIRVLVTGGNDHDDSGFDGAGDDVVLGAAVWATKGHVGNCGSLSLSHLFDDPSDGLEDRLRVSRASAVKSLDGDELDLSGDTVGGRSDSSGDVSAMALAVRVGSIDGVGAPNGSVA